MALLLVMVLLAAPPTAEQLLSSLTPAPEPGWAMHTVRVGRAPNAKRALFIDDESLGPTMEIAFAFWTLRGFGRRMLIDTGFVSQERIRAWGVRDYRNPVAGLAVLGIEPEQITDVVITHHHWDHTGGLRLFPNADIWISPRALARTKRSRDSTVVGALRAADRAGRLHETSHRQTIAPGVMVAHLGLHTPGFQLVLVGNPEGNWVFASDIVPTRANLVRSRPTGLTSDPQQTLAVMAAMRSIGSQQLARIIPGHEARGFDSRGIIQLVWPKQKPAP